MGPVQEGSQNLASVRAWYRWASTTRKQDQPTLTKCGQSTEKGTLAARRSEREDLFDRIWSNPCLPPTKRCHPMSSPLGDTTCAGMVCRSPPLCPWRPHHRDVHTIGLRVMLCHCNWLLPLPRPGSPRPATWAACAAEPAPRGLQTLAIAARIGRRWRHTERPLGQTRSGCVTIKRLRDVVWRRSGHGLERTIGAKFWARPEFACSAMDIIPAVRQTMVLRCISILFMFLLRGYRMVLVQTSLTHTPTSIGNAKRNL